MLAYLRLLRACFEGCVAHSGAPRIELTLQFGIRTRSSSLAGLVGASLAGTPPLAVFRNNATRRLATRPNQSMEIHGEVGVTVGFRFG